MYNSYKLWFLTNSRYTRAIVFYKDGICTSVTINVAIQQYCTLQFEHLMSLQLVS